MERGEFLKGAAWMAVTTAALLAAGALCGCDSAVTLERGRTEVVIATDAPKTARFAAQEMTNFLSRVLGGEVPLVEEKLKVEVEERTGQFHSSTSTRHFNSRIYLGDNEWSRAAGLDPAKLPRDGFQIKAEGNCVYIAGVDDPEKDLADTVRRGILEGRESSIMFGERGTLFGVYEFLERAAGCRFYFPGELGEVVPQKAKVEVPYGLVSKSPDFLVRNLYFNNDGYWPGEKSRSDRNAIKALNWLRLRLQTQNVPCCHGINNFQLPDRFAKTHPEWFRLRKHPVTGKLERFPGEDSKLPNNERGHFCFTNDGLWDQVFKDTTAYFDGKRGEEIGLKRQWDTDSRGWGPNVKGNFVDVMAQDGMQECFCEKCQAAYEKERGGSGFASELIWKKTGDLAKRLADAGYPAIVTQMAYGQYSAVPTCDIPSNVWVMVKAAGPWAVGNKAQYDQEMDFVRAWAEKLGHKVWLWTYPGKHPDDPINIKGLPDFAPRAWYRAYKEFAKYSFGTFAETENTDAILHYLNYYVFAQLAWNPDLDIDALLDEHYRLMFGAAAPKMQEAFEFFERKWVGEIVGKYVDTPLGPKPQAPSLPEVWSRIWNRPALDKVSRLFAEAAAAVPAGSLEARRVAFMKEGFLDPLLAAGIEKTEAMDVARAQERRNAHPPKNLLENGSFDPKAGGWSMAKPNGYDTTTFVSAPASFRIENKDGKGWSTCRQSMVGKFKDNTTYRISFFVKLDDVKALTRGGHSCWAINYYETWHCLPGGGMHGGFHQGTADWFYFEGTFKTGVRDPRTKNAPCFDWGFNGNVMGTAWIDDVVLEEVAGP